ncbi:MAG: hypothetical protein HY275_03225 [Gemmatimonadetes bacterium]|nr:hypothetical protein [Gemmatimonadota bacterium]
MRAPTVPASDAPVAAAVRVPTPAPTLAPPPAVPPIVYTDASLAELLARFEATTLARAEFTHAAHVAVGTAVVLRDGPRALDVLRDAIRRFNAAHGVAQTPDGGYHETLTHFYAWAVAREVAQLDPALGPGAIATRVVAALTDRSLPLRHWTKPRLMSWAARTGFVEPDLRPLD